MLNSGRKEQIYVSVIMPSLNVAPYIEMCMDSVLCQTLQQIEILCIDAGSTDGTLEILKKYALKDERIRILESSRKSYGYQINLGIKEAKGQYIGIVETDDFIDASMYRELYSYTQKDFPDFIKGGFYDYAEFENKKFISESSLRNLSEELGKLLDLRKKRENGFLVLNHIWAGIYRREFLLEKDIRLNETPGASYQDIGFSMLVGLLADTSIYVKGSYYYYRRNNGNSSVKSTSKWRCVIDEVEYITQEILKKGKYSADTELLIWKYKTAFYFWNFLRLPERERERFLNEINWELERYEEDSDLNDLLSAGQKEMVEVMKSREASQHYFAQIELQKKKYENVISLFRQGRKCVLVSAGRYGEHILFLQDITGTESIDAVADNSREKQGCDWNGYTLMSISEAVHNYGEDWFIVANKKYAGEIQVQLTEAGISENKILVFDNILSADKVIELMAGEES